MTHDTTMESYKIRVFRSSDRDAILRLTVDSFVNVSIERNAEDLFGPIHGKDWKSAKRGKLTRSCSAIRKEYLWRIAAGK